MEKKIDNNKLEEIDGLFNKLFDKLDVLVEELEVNTGKNMVEKQEGNVINIENGIYLTDPCYSTTTWCQQLLEDVKSGKWLVDYEYNEYEDGTEQEVILSLAHEDYGMAIFSDFYDEVIDSVALGVDSGTIGVFDKDYYEKYHYANSINDDWYDNNICLSSFRRGANITDEKGVWVNTSCGDGEYVAQLYKKDGKIYGIEIIC